MQLNQKIKEYRKIFGLSQEDLAQKLNVSRQAITKWETDGGMPDISNLKSMSELFGVSIDYLLDDEKDVYNPIMKEPLVINGKNNLSTRYDYAVALLKERYPEAKIYPLFREKNLSKVELVINYVLTDFMLEWADMFKNGKNIWFLVKKDTQKLLIKVTKEHIETTELSNLITEEKFVVEDNKFEKMKEI